MNTLTPQQALTEFLSCWQKRDYSSMSRLLPVKGTPPKKQTIKATKELYGGQKLTGFNLLSAHDTDPAAANLDVELHYREAGEMEVRRWRFRMVYVNDAGQPIPRNQPLGSWKPYVRRVLPDPPALRA
ncbi:hypothetical protein [Deinococcus arenicola]|uniref:Uncharacterized protein n=1 Tax=Deinococcus arenicola TaxID=2994950 RepID=A0ABU4DRN2_9DEIO|nr:hypothetical protein [Deinococcus sp. ZS9-10]MDV6375101.1 hypothetical protein [Deinococcus sp. ZS9-10]